MAPRTVRPLSPRARGLAALLALVALLATFTTVPAAAAVGDWGQVASGVTLRIARQETVAGGYQFGPAGAYEKLVGTIAFEVDPADPRNAAIIDLDRAPRNARGLVEYDTDFYLLRPLDMDRWNGKLFFEVNNRGNKRTFNYVQTSAASQPRLNDPTAPEDFGDAFLLRQGYAIAWAGWEGDVLPGGGRMTIRLPVPREADGGPIAQRIVVEFHDRYFAPDGSTTRLPLSGSPDFASYPAVGGEMANAELRVRPSDSPRPSGPDIPAGTLVPRDQWSFASPTEIALPGGFQPGQVYELSYVAQDPRVMALGYAATRDVVSFLRHSSRDSAGTPNPLAVGDGVTHVLGQGISSSGMYLRDFLYQGFNEDLAGRPVFDGLSIHIPGAHKLFLNYRFAQPNPFSVQHRDRYMPYVGFPFNYGVRENPLVAGGTMDGPSEDGILKRPATDPLVIHTDTSTEYWQFQAALVNTDGFGRDVPLPAGVRQYLLSGLHHAVTPGAPPALGLCQQPSNPTHAGPALRALITALDGWVTAGTPPPPSRRPTVADGTLVPTDRASTGFPAIPGVAYNGLYNAAAERDFGPRVAGNRGIIDNWRHAVVLQEYEVLVPATSRVGIDEGGVPVPQVAVPTATLTGWNLRRAPHTEGDI